MLVEDIDPQGKISLKPIGPEWEVPEGADPTAAAASVAREPGGRGGERVAEAAASARRRAAAAAARPRGTRFRDQPSGERTDAPPAE